MGKASQVEPSRSEIVAWVASQILPHERDVRGWLRRRGTADHEIDDLVQEAYCRLASLVSVSHILNGRAYFFQIVRNIAIERTRRARVVRIESLTEMSLLSVYDNEPSPERVAASRSELRRVNDLIEGLPKRCREIFKLRRIHGMPQRQIAMQLGVTENVVEMQTARGLRLILAALATQAPSSTPAMARDCDFPKKRNRD